jgi:hypothetical protein
MRKKTAEFKVLETILRTTEFEQMDALHQHILTQAVYVSNGCNSLFIPFDCRTYVENSSAHTHTVLVYTVLRQPQHNYRSRLIIRISLPPSALTVSFLLSLPLPLQLLIKFLYTHLPSLTTQLNFHPFLIT